MGDCCKIEGLELEECARQEVIRGCELARQLESKLNSATGCDLHGLVERFATELVAAFSRALKLMNSEGNPNSVDWQGDLGKQILGRGNSRGMYIKGNKLNSPRSGEQSPGSDVSEGGFLPAKLKCGEAADSSENGLGVLKDRRDISRKRKSLPTWTEKQPANVSEPGNDMPRDDGYTWRKYGQKDILGATHPRSYYRCTHKNDMGCQAKKQVQRTEEDPAFFEVTYRGEHTCRVDRHILPIPVPFSLAQIGVDTDSNSSVPNTLFFGTEFNLQSNFSAGLGLLPSHLNSGSRQASISRFGVDSMDGQGGNEDLDNLRQSAVSALFLSWPNFLHSRPNEGNSGNDAIQPNKPAKVCASLHRKQNGEDENMIDSLPPQPYDSTAFSEGQLGMENFSPIFGSAATTELSYIPLAPPMPEMNPMESANLHGHVLQTSESDLTDVVSGHTSAADSPMLDMDMMFNTNLDSLFSFERNEPF